MNAVAAVRSVRVTHYCPWAARKEPADSFLGGLSDAGIMERVARPDDAELVRMARLDRDWHAENVRSLAAISADGLEFERMDVVGATGMRDLVGSGAPRRAADGTEDWFVVTGQHPQALGSLAAPLFRALTRAGYRILYYAFDEASRTMPVCAAIAPFLTVLIHDEAPLSEAVCRALPRGCRTIHRSWVANLTPFQAPFVDAPERRILFLGSKLGMTPHRSRQIAHLSRHFSDRFVAISDHSVSVADQRGSLRYSAAFCPEGRKFTTPSMAATHTDRPFWSGCLGMIPVSEDSKTGGRLESLHRSGLIIRYPWADLAALTSACEHALEADTASRRAVYDHFNREETVGAVIAAAIAATPPEADAR